MPDPRTRPARSYCGGNRHARGLRPHGQEASGLAPRIRSKMRRLEQERTRMPSEKPKCQALKKNGKPCGAAPTKTGLCFFHSNPNLVAELGRVGGRRSHRSQTESLIASRLES